MMTFLLTFALGALVLLAFTLMRRHGVQRLAAPPPMVAPGVRPPHFVGIAWSAQEETATAFHSTSLTQDLAALNTKTSGDFQVVYVERISEGAWGTGERRFQELQGLPQDALLAVARSQNPNLAPLSI